MLVECSHPVVNQHLTRAVISFIKPTGDQQLTVNCLFDPLS